MDPSYARLSFAQEELWFVDRLRPGSVDYLLSQALRISGPLDRDALAAAFATVAARHEILRTRFEAPDGTPAQVIDPPGPVAFTVVACAEADTGQALDAELAKPLDLAAEHPVRVTLLAFGPEEHVLLIVVHHIAFDGWSWANLNSELWRHYREPDADLTELPVQYADFAEWQRDWLTGQALTDRLGYWRDRLAGVAPLDLPTDHPRAPHWQPGGAAVSFEVPEELVDRVTEAGRERDATAFMVLLAAFQVLLGRYSGQRDIAVGTPLMGRDSLDLEQLVGFFVNTVVVRTDLDPDASFAAVLAQVRGTVLSALDHQEVPFAELVSAVAPDRDLSRNPLFQAMFGLQNLGAAEPVTPPGLTVRQAPAPYVASPYDLSLMLTEGPGRSLTASLQYATALFDEATAHRLARHYLALLRAVLAAPDEPVGALELLTGPERRQLLTDWNDHPAEAGPASVVALFEAQVERDPDAIAVVFGRESLTYRELDVRANRLAHHLRERGVGRETVVGVLLERGLDVAAVLLGVLKAGGCYVPFDPEHPAARLGFLLADAGAELVLTQERFAHLVTGFRTIGIDKAWPGLAGYPDTAPESQAGPDDLAYIIYTSGSTGVPKGVMIQHASYAQHCRVIAAEYGVAPGERVVLLSALTFDVAMDQLAATLATGATVVVADPLFWSPDELPDRLAEHGVTIVEITPAYYREMLRTLSPGDDRLRQLKLMNVGSDVVTVDDALRWFRTGLPGRFLCNYGPTEATVTCLLHPVPEAPSPDHPEEALPIGRPVAGTTAYVLDGYGNPVPVGVAGELHLGGLRLARGYHRRPGLTARQFVPDPFGTTPGARLYRTGDLARYRPDGTIEFLGRIDQQVKIRGFRIELGEIEAVLARHPSVQAVAVTAPEIRTAERQLVAHLVLAEGASLDAAELRRHALEQLPGYMVPAVWAPLPRLPLTTSGKVDRRALPVPSRTGEVGSVEPATPVEALVAATWAEVLGVEKVGVTDDFFVLGGHSLLAARVQARLREDLGADLPLCRLFDSRTVRELAADVAETTQGTIFTCVVPAPEETRS